MTVLAWLLLCAAVVQLGKGNASVPSVDGRAQYASHPINTSPPSSQTDWEMHGNTATSADLKEEITANSSNGRKKRDESRKSEQSSGRSSAKKDKEQPQKEEYDETVRMLSLAFGSAIGALILITVIAIIVLVLYYRRKNRKAGGGNQQKREELTAANGLTIIRREGMADKYVVKGCDFRIRGPLVRGRVHAEPPTKHALDDQVGGDKIDDIFFDKNLNDAYFIGEGVEIVEEDSVSVSEGKDSKGNAIELFAMMDTDDMMGLNSQKSKKKKVDPNTAKNPRAKMSSKSSKSKRGAKPASNPLNPPSSGSNPKKTSSSGSSGKKK